MAVLKTACVAAAGALACVSAAASVLTVGPGARFSRPSEAAAIAKDGDRVFIAAGDYRDDVCVWRASNLTIAGEGADRTVLHAGARLCQGKAIWVLAGTNTVVSGLAFCGARCPDRNGAGIRLDGTGLTVCACRFEENENGILCGANGESDVRISDSLFRRNGAGDGFSHNLYIGDVRSLTVERCVSDHARKGHALKSRARRTVVTDSRFDDGEDGESSYLVNLPNGGRCSLSGCYLRQSPRAANKTMVSVGEEGAYPDSRLETRDNVFVDGTGKGRTIVRKGF